MNELDMRVAGDSDIRSAKPRYTMKKWKLIPSWSDMRKFKLQGYIKGHPKAPDEAKLFFTSTVLRIDFEKGEAETKNSIYTLKV